MIGISVNLGFYLTISSVAFLATVGRAYFLFTYRDPEFSETATKKMLLCAIAFEILSVITGFSILFGIPEDCQKNFVDLYSAAVPWIWGNFFVTFQLMACYFLNVNKRP